MHTTDWKAVYQQRLASDDFTSTVKEHLKSIREAAPEARPSLAAQFAGWLRLRRTYARVELTQALADELRIVTTQKVALMLMHTAFGAGTTKGFINDRFALTGRTAATKYMNAARDALASKPEVIEKYKQLYAWYCACLAEQTALIKRGDNAAPRRHRKKKAPESAAAGYIRVQRAAPVQPDLFA